MKSTAHLAAPASSMALTATTAPGKAAWAAITGDTITPGLMDRLAIGMARNTKGMPEEKKASRIASARKLLAGALGRGMEIRPVGEVGDDGRIRTAQFKRERPRLVPGAELRAKEAARREKAKLEAPCRRLPADAPMAARKALHKGMMEKRRILRNAVAERLVTERAAAEKAWLKANPGKDLPAFRYRKHKEPTVPFGAHDARRGAAMLARAQMLAKIAGTESAIDETTLAILANAGNTEGAAV